MLNAFQSPQSVALIGATSQIGLSILANLPSENLDVCLLAARKPEIAVKSCQRLLPPRTNVFGFDFSAEDLDSHEALVDQLFSHGDLDMAIIAAGVLGNDPELSAIENARSVMQVNYVACAHLLLLIAARMQSQGHGRIEVISSFAQSRPRVDNFIYGSSKAGLDFMAQGLNESLRGSGVSVCILRPGFVRTRMTKDMKEAPFARDAGAVGKIGANLLMSQAQILYAPSILKTVALVFRLLPGKIFRKISSRG